MARKRMTRTIKAIRSGQITIPADFRRALNITDDSLLQMSIEDEAGSPWLAELYERFAPVRREAVEAGYGEVEINEAMDQAVAAARAKHD